MRRAAAVKNALSGTYIISFPINNIRSSHSGSPRAFILYYTIILLCTRFIYTTRTYIIRFYIILFRGKRAAALFRPSDRICGRDEKEELHRGEWHKRASVDVTHIIKNDEEIARLYGRTESIVVVSPSCRPRTGGGEK